MEFYFREPFKVSVDGAIGRHVMLCHHTAQYTDLDSLLQSLAKTIVKIHNAARFIDIHKCFTFLAVIVRGACSSPKSGSALHCLFRTLCQVLAARL